MKSRRKIWSLPLVLVTALLLVGLFGAAVLAQTNDAPVVENDLADVITDKVLELAGGSPATATADLAEVFDDTTMVGDPAVEVDDRLAFTVMTSAPNTASVAFTTGTAYNETAAPPAGVVANWWNSLDQAEKRAVVGVKLDNTLAIDNPARGTCDNTVWCKAYNHDSAANTPDVTVIGAYGPDVLNEATAPVAIPEIDNPAARLIVTQAFHWDMLTGAEMVAAARAGGIVSPGNYAKPFRQLSEDTTDGQGATIPGQRTNVQALYTTRADDTDTEDVDEARAAVLQRGQGSGDLDGQTADEEQAASLTVTAGDVYADIGTATITVKASDSYGRLIPPDTGRETVGDSVDIEVNGKELEDLRIPTVQTGVTFEGDNALTPNTVEPDTFVFIIESTAKTAGAIDVVSNDEVDSTTHDSEIDGDVTADTPVTTTYDDIRGRLRDGAGFPFRVNQTGVRDADSDVFTISVPEGRTLDLADSPYEFTFEAYALSNIVNVTSIEIRVELAVGNQPPVFTPAALAQTAADVSEVTKVGDTVATFSASDPDNTTGINYVVSGGDGYFEIDSSGKLKVAKALDYQGDEEASGDDPEAVGYVPAEEAGDDNENNIFELTITATDGEHTVMHTFTVTITDSPDVPATGSRAFTIDENTGNEDDAEEGEDPEYYLVDSDGAKARVLLLDDEGVPVADTFTYKIDVRNSPEVEVALFDIQEDGTLFLKAGGALDFETEDRYLLSVKATNNTVTPVVTQSGAVIITIANVAESPEFTRIPGNLNVPETANVGDPVMDTKGTVDLTDDVAAIFEAEDDDAGQIPTFSLLNEDGTAYTDGMFEIGSSSGALTVGSALNAEIADTTIELKVQASDAGSLPEAIDIVITIGDANEAPNFLTPAGGTAEVDIPENTTYDAIDPVVAFTAIDPDGDDLTFTIREGSATALFEIAAAMKDATSGEWGGELRVNRSATLDYDTDDYNKETGYRVHIEVQDNEGLSDTLAVDVKLENVNDNEPAFAADAATRVQVAENTPRGIVIGNYPATDDDGDIVTYSLSGTNGKSFAISETGDLMTLESLDYDSGTPCDASLGCSINVVASDNREGSDDATLPVTITVGQVEDSVSTLSVSKANPVPGTTKGNPMSALANTKTTKSSAVPERPAGLPATYGGAPMNFVETDWANWGTVLRIEVISQSPDANCGSGNECVVISVNSDSADDTLKLQAYRMDTPAGAASNENKFVAAVMLVELDGEATNVKDASKNDIPVYAHTDGSVARLQVDEEDEIEIEFGNLRGDVDVENEAPEISNFAPEHEAAFDDADVDYTFTVTDTHSGLPEPEDLPDADGDDAYMPAVALISKGQCETAGSDTSAESKARRAKLIHDGFELVGDMENISDDESLYCPGAEQDGEYDAAGAGYGFAPIRDDKDFDEIDDGFDVETTIVLRENRIFYVTFVACDNAGNCSFFDPDGNDESEELAQITVDTEDPIFVEARTGLTWDSTDNEYDDNRSFIQVIFNDLTKLNTETVEIDDFVVEGHTIKDVQVFENPDSDDVDWGDSGRYGAAGSSNKRGIDRYRDIENVVFIELEDELLADETPDVTIVPNGVEDKAGNEQDDGDHEADDWISPAFTIVSIVSTRETSQDQILAGDDDEVTIVVTSDERLDSTRPTVAVTYVNAPAGSIDTKGTATCDTSEGADKGTRERGEIVSNDKCADSGAATGGNLNNSVEKVSNTEWIVTITEPKATGYYNFRISGNDRSPQENPGSEGVSPGSIVTDFFDADGDVNVDDAIFFEGDINLPKPQVRVSGVSVEDNEADVEFRSPLFVELDFAANHSDNCRNVDSDERMSNCMNENSEYAEDNFDDIIVTSFVLDGVDLTDSVKTTDNQSFLVSLESISIGDHTAEVQAVDQAGNVFEDTLEIDFEVNDRDPFDKRLSPGWNLVSLPGEPADSSIAAVFGPGVEVRTVYSYDPVIPGGWMVAVRETLDSDWQGDLTEITGRHGYWVLSDAIQDWEVSIPRLAGGASGTGTPIQPPVIPMYAGWNLIPVTDVSGNALSAGIEIDAAVYLRSLDDGLDLARVLGYDTIRNEWFTVLDMQMGSPGDLSIGSGYWVFVREAVALVPGGVAGVGGGD